MTVPLLHLKHKAITSTCTYRLGHAMDWARALTVVSVTVVSLAWPCRVSATPVTINFVGTGHFYDLDFQNPGNLQQAFTALGVFEGSPVSFSITIDNAATRDASGTYVGALMRGWFRAGPLFFQIGGGDLGVSLSEPLGGGYTGIYPGLHGPSFTTSLYEAIPSWALFNFPGQGGVFAPTLAQALANPYLWPAQNFLFGFQPQGSVPQRGTIEIFFVDGHVTSVSVPEANTFGLICGAFLAWCLCQAASGNRLRR
jgi:hypothetical protein